LPGVAVDAPVVVACHGVVFVEYMFVVVDAVVVMESVTLPQQLITCVN